MMEPFEQLARDQAFTSESLVRAYRDMPKVNFSFDILERVPGRIIVEPMRAVQWCDWGRPDRVRASLGEMEPVRGNARSFKKGGSVLAPAMPRSRLGCRAS